MDPNYVKNFFATQVKHALEETIKEFLDDLRSNMTLQEIEDKWEKKLQFKNKKDDFCQQTYSLSAIQYF